MYLCVRGERSCMCVLDVYFISISSSFIFSFVCCVVKLKCFFYFVVHILHHDIFVL